MGMNSPYFFQSSDTMPLFWGKKGRPKFIWSDLNLTKYLPKSGSKMAIMGILSRGYRIDRPLFRTKQGFHVVQQHKIDRAGFFRILPYNYTKSTLRENSAFPSSTRWNRIRTYKSVPTSKRAMPKNTPILLQIAGQHSNVSP